ncbi:Pentapeptide repeat family protein [uncultured Microcoleus sp.]|uniref:Pentapeptide repeat family protein n=1 Tax=uncultured Microcoleus sp. TaxID=259945 RepID=A0A6J4LJG8_9CYAN|nr:Pentapeptide repeat family protein [uncultured Microcoleus sp.]
MKLGILTTTGLLIAIGCASGVKAENVSHVKQLLETKM